MRNKQTQETQETQEEQEIKEDNEEEEELNQIKEDKDVYNAIFDGLQSKNTCKLIYFSLFLLLFLLLL